MPHCLPTRRSTHDGDVADCADLVAADGECRRIPAIQSQATHCPDEMRRPEAPRRPTCSIRPDRPTGSTKSAQSDRPTVRPSDRGVRFHRRTRTHEVAVSKRRVDPADGRPHLVLARRRRRETGAGRARRAGPRCRSRDRRAGGARASAGCYRDRLRRSRSRGPSPRIAISASTNRSSSTFGSLSVGSIISVPATGNETVGDGSRSRSAAWRCLRPSTPAEALNGRVSMMHSCATRPCCPA